MSEWSSINYAIKSVDVTDRQPFSEAIAAYLGERHREEVDFMIAHPPYLDIVKFTDDSRDQSNISDIDAF